MEGGSGNDAYSVDSVDDKVVEAANAGIDSVRSTITYALGENFENLTLAGNAIGGHGNALNNQITGNALDNVLVGYEGNDTVSGGAGRDTLHGNEGNDALNGGLGADTMIGGIGNDSYYFDDAGDQIIEYAGEGTETVTAMVNYTLGENLENVKLWGTADLLAAGNSLANVMSGNTGSNTLQGYEGNDKLSGADGKELLIGCDDNDYLSGDAGDDTLLGGAGVDTLIGGAGADRLEGGSGKDVFIFAKASDLQGDIVEDFELGDRLDLRSIDAVDGAAKNYAFFFIGTAVFSGQAGQLRYEVIDGTSYISGNTNGDGAADFGFAVLGQHMFAASDFIL